VPRGVEFIPVMDLGILFQKTGRERKGRNSQTERNHSKEGKTGPIQNLIFQVGGKEAFCKRHLHNKVPSK